MCTAPETCGGGGRLSVCGSVGDAHAGDSGSASLDWFPGNYGLTDTTNRAARDAFLTGLSNAFKGVELIYQWAKCESGTVMGDYSACFTAIDADLTAAKLAGKHIILMLQYKGFGSAGDAGTGVDAVPAYLLSGPGTWCATGTPFCGEYKTTKGSIAMIWNGAVATRLQKWFAALGQYYGPGGNGHPLVDSIAGIALPETATGTNNMYPLTAVGYSPGGYLTAIKANLSALNAAFPTKPVFQYINFLPNGSSSELQSIGDFALTQRNVGLGCPDVAGNSYDPPGYDTLINPHYQLHLPFNVAVEPMDFSTAYTPSIQATYARATNVAQDGGMAAQFVMWWYVQGGAGNAFTIDQVANYLLSHPDPNVAY
jgi:hypothetical protein